MKTSHQVRNTARPHGATADVREILVSVLPGSIIAPVSGGRLLPRLPLAAIRGAMIPFC